VAKRSKIRWRSWTRVMSRTRTRVMSRIVVVVALLLAAHFFRAKTGELK
jgi:hypothetical protein